MGELSATWAWGGELLDLLPADDKGRQRLVRRRDKKVVGFVRAGHVVYVIEFEEIPKNSGNGALDDPGTVNQS